MYNEEPVHLEPWLRSWDALSRLSGLRRLHIHLDYNQVFWNGEIDTAWNEKGAALLGRVKDITAPRDFVIFLPHARCATDLDVGNPRCVLKIRDNGSEHVALPL